MKSGAKAHGVNHSLIANDYHARLAMTRDTHQPEVEHNTLGEGEKSSSPSSDPHDPAQHLGLLDRWASAFTTLGRPIGELAPVALPLSLLTKAFPAFRTADFRLIWSGALVSNIGTWMQNVARDWLVYQLSGETGKFWLGLNGFVEGLAVVALLPLGGALADRIDRRKLLIIANAYQALLAIILTVLAATGALQAWHVVLMTALNGLGESVRIPSQQSLIPSLVPREHMVNAMALGSMQFNLSRAIGPALAGLVLYYWGAAWGFGINALSFIGVIGATWLLRPLPENPRKDEPIFTSLRLGFEYVKQRKDLLLMLATVFATGAFMAPTIKMLPAMAEEMLQGDERTFANLLTWFGIGAMFGAMMLATRSSRGPTPHRAWPLVMLLGAGQWLLAWLGAWLPESMVLWGFKIMCALLGMAFIGVMVRLNTTVMVTSPGSMRGRVSSFHMLAFRLGMPLGAMLAGGLAQGLNLPMVFQGFGVGLIVIGGCVMILARRIVWVGAQDRGKPGEAA